MLALVILHLLVHEHASPPRVSSLRNAGLVQVISDGLFAVGIEFHFALRGRVFLVTLTFPIAFAVNRVVVFLLAGFAD